MGLAYVRKSTAPVPTLNVVTDIDTSIYRSEAFTLSIYATDGNGCIIDSSAVVTLALNEAGVADADDALYASDGGAELTTVTLSHGVWTSETPVIADGTGTDATTIVATATGYAEGESSEFNVLDTFVILGNVTDSLLELRVNVIADDNYAYLNRETYNAAKKALVKVDLSGMAVATSATGENSGYTFLEQDTDYIYIAGSNGIYKYDKATLTLEQSNTVLKFNSTAIVVGNYVYVGQDAGDDFYWHRLLKSDLSVDASSDPFEFITFDNGHIDGSFIYALSDEDIMYKIATTDLTVSDTIEDGGSGYLVYTDTVPDLGRHMASDGTRLFICFHDALVGRLVSIDLATFEIDTVREDAVNFLNICSLSVVGDYLYASVQGTDSVLKLSKTDLSTVATVTTSTYLGDVCGIYANNGILHCACYANNMYSQILL